VFGVTRVTNGFNAKKLCDRRRYKYVLPEWAFDPSAPLSSSAAAAAAAAAAAGGDAPPPFRLDDAGLARLNGLLGRFVGTHNFHNYTVRVRPDDPSARRYILAFAASPPSEAHGARLVTLQVLGQSFMLHQIRKMVGTALAIMRGALPEEHLVRALSSRDNVVRAGGHACVLAGLRADTWAALHCALVQHSQQCFAAVARCVCVCVFVCAVDADGA
jgi:tRNA pseudouridine38-40 synthase